MLRDKYSSAIGGRALTSASSTFVFMRLLVWRKHLATLKFFFCLISYNSYLEKTNVKADARSFTTRFESFSETLIELTSGLAFADVSKLADHWRRCQAAWRWFHLRHSTGSFSLQVCVCVFKLTVMAADGHQCPCCSHPVSSVHQTMDEMDFERGSLRFSHLKYIHLSEI